MIKTDDVEDFETLIGNFKELMKENKKLKLKVRYLINEKNIDKCQQNIDFYFQKIDDFVEDVKKQDEEEEEEKENELFETFNNDLIRLKEYEENLNILREEQKTIRNSIKEFMNEN
jgi:hypothetical protein